ncbi:hypothetical protein JG687_00013493 [Phytophthora cactorum]|uniref:Homeodomain-like n=1 Tax=Phytophthora cactorum TaxID=29920 RepID=A0A329SL35_9STRA|nr:hypothetical protein Pcac1_g18918 [Phytophthora cactorum]KAG2823677.1 hypothetical protein PC112_g10421 [Phytophthora cactorum]KAG2832497.1 hypothetical protein PC111_g6589 [Phytophthora cactorum]KAG2863886.1 hypothetical protein PC113_g5065 [Phytophthora cactorum]KAG2881856.1 hypothetical protein PC114_g21355 [Phytophthora cactorum]
MPLRPKNKNKEKQKGAISELSVVETAALFNATRATIYRWRKDKKKLKEAAKEAPNKYFAPSEPTKPQCILYPELKTR